MNEKLIKLASDVLILSRNTLLVNLRFLDMALSQFKMIPVEKSTLLTDGEHIFYHPRFVLQRYKAEKEIPVRDYLHMVLHCVFRHMYMDPTLERAWWDLSCDIAVENVISELGLKATSCARERQQQKYLDELRKGLKTVTAEKIYHYLRTTAADPQKAAELRGLFYADDHEIWYMTSQEIQNALGLGGSESQSDSDGTERSADGNGDEAGQTDTSRTSLVNTWKEIGEKLQMDLETFSKQQGDKAGSLMQSLSEINREKYDYTAFLKRFATLGEVMKINDDEFDYVFYTYGLKLYENMPLIEPLEYKEVKRIKEFVIAIDTSGSTSGELVQKFVQKTYNILKSTESFFSKINLHIIQCDAVIQEHVKITCQEDFDRYLNTMKLHGLGGTDFRPVFQLVEELTHGGEFTNLKGMIYFTDGYGTFPARKPNFDTAFVFIEDGYNNPDVPPWAIKLVLQKDEI